MKTFATKDALTLINDLRYAYDITKHCDKESKPSFETAPVLGCVHLLNGGAIHYRAYAVRDSCHGPHLILGISVRHPKDNPDYAMVPTNTIMFTPHDIVKAMNHPCPGSFNHIRDMPFPNNYSANPLDYMIHLLVQAMLFHNYNSGTISVGWLKRYISLCYKHSINPFMAHHQSNFHHHEIMFTHIYSVAGPQEFRLVFDLINKFIGDNRALVQEVASGANITTNTVLNTIVINAEFVKALYVNAKYPIPKSDSLLLRTIAVIGIINDYITNGIKLNRRITNITNSLASKFVVPK